MSATRLKCVCVAEAVIFVTTKTRRPTAGSICGFSDVTLEEHHLTTDSKIVFYFRH